LRLICSGTTHTGLVRRKNEDCLHIDPLHRFFIVADGVGGRKGGEIASRSACRFLSMHLPVLWNAIRNRNIRGRKVEKKLSDLLQETSDYVRDVGELESQGGIGTTLTALLVYGNTGWVMHIGDSRCYIHRNRMGWRQITHDDSLVQSLIESGILSGEEKRRFIYRNVITQALGLTEDLEPHIYMLNLKKGDFLLLSSDGFHGFVEEEKWQYLPVNFLTRRKVREYVETLLNLSLESGGKDNITILGIKVL